MGRVFRAWMAGVLAAGCTSAGSAPGTLDVQLSGGNAVEAPVPAGEFQDGWQLSFTQLLVVFTDLTVSSSTDPLLVARDGRSVLVDLVQSGPHAWASMSAPLGTYDRSAFSMKSATAQTIPLHSTAADLQRMVAGGYSMLASGTLTRGTEREAFSWGFQGSTRYSDCAVSLRVVSGATTTTRYTLHGEQLFLESLAGTAAPRLRAQSQAAADANHDGTITVEELAAVSVGTASGAEFPATGAATFVRTLRQFEEIALARSVVLSGETRCSGVSLDSPAFKDGGP